MKQTNSSRKMPFFARLLENQNPADRARLAQSRGGEGTLVTAKYPSDSDEDAAILDKADLNEGLSLDVKQGLPPRKDPA